MNKDDNMVELHYKNLSLDDIVYVDDNGVQCTEVWRDVPEYEGLYQISDLGRLKSFKNIKEKILKATIGTTGYLIVALSKKSKLKTLKIHQLVAICFLNHKCCGFKIIVDHISNNRLDNRVRNLQLITNRLNATKDRDVNFLGVSKSANRFSSAIYVNGKTLSLGTFDTQEEATEYYQNAVKAIENGKEIKHNRKEKTSKFKGVHFSNIRKNWVSTFIINKNNNYIGVFKTEQEAYEARENYIKNLNLQE